MCFRAINFSLVKLVLPVWYISLLTQCGNRENELVDFSLHWRRKKALNIYIYIYIFFFEKIKNKRVYISKRLLVVSWEEKSNMKLSLIWDSPKYP